MEKYVTQYINFIFLPNVLILDFNFLYDILLINPQVQIYM